ncbi:hypothetical protein M9H77_30176 [Catharanthus roseus]|uniref:Uncharacterized protein n=1 Tax=Catharanthus roseus TaxID=4058 RepID=A0ACB9ZWV4_CATRO|nr:hypothetical protein M9H77_30176 [Catharanthus roseus]
MLFIEETKTNKIKNKNEGFNDEGQSFKLLILYTISNDYSKEQFGLILGRLIIKRDFKTSNLNMEEGLCHMQQPLEGLEQQLSCLAKGVKDLRKEEEAILEQSSRRNLGGHPMKIINRDRWNHCSIPIV